MREACRGAKRSWHVTLNATRTRSRSGSEQAACVLCRVNYTYMYNIIHDMMCSVSTATGKLAPPIFRVVGCACVCVHGDYYIPRTSGTLMSVLQVLCMCT